MDLPIGEMKKNNNNKRKCQGSFIRHNSAVWRLLVFYLVSIAPPWQRKIVEKKGNSDDSSRLFKIKLYFLSRKDFFNLKGVGLGKESSNNNIDWL